MARRARVLHACIALAPACTFHGGTCFGKGRSHFVIAFLPLLPFSSHPKENQATYSSSTRATDLRQLRDLCKPFSLSLDSIISLDLPFISTNISRPLPLFSTYLPLSPSKLLQEARKREKYIKSKLHDSVFGKRVEKIELVIFVWIFWDPEAVENYYCARWWVV